MKIPMKKMIRKRKYAIVFGMTITIFIFGLLIGSMFTSQKLANVRELQDSLRSDTLDIEVMYSLLENEPCKYVDMGLLVEDLQSVAEKVDYLEGELGKENYDVLRLKKYYSLLQLRQWIFEERVQEECSQNKNIILYFYNNEPGACSSCEQQGFILSYLRKKYSEDLSVYSFDIIVDSVAVQTVVNNNQITETPAMVINGELLVGFHKTEEIESRLNT